MARRNKQTRRVRDFWNRTLQAAKVRQALDSMGADAAEFEEAYNATSRRRGRQRKPLSERFTDEQMEQIRTFRENGGIHGLAGALDVSTTTARGILAQALEEGMF